MQSALSDTRWRMVLEPQLFGHNIRWYGSIWLASGEHSWCRPWCMPGRHARHSGRRWRRWLVRLLLKWAAGRLVCAAAAPGGSGAGRVWGREFLAGWRRAGVAWYG